MEFPAILLPGVATGNGIRFTGTNGTLTAYVYSTSGQLIYKGTDAEIALPQGMYIVKLGNAVNKVIVK